MKTIIVILLTLFCNISFAQKSDTYKIEKLPKPVGYLEQFSTSVQFNDSFKEDSILKSRFPNYYKNPFRGNWVEKTSKLPDSLVYSGEHPFLSGIVTAYREDRPFTISPDIIWLLISQGLARHITNNSEELRKDIVDFAGKEVLSVATTAMLLNNPDANWEDIFPQFTKQIADYTGKELIDELTANFSTSTQTTEIASQITVMEALKNFFDYKVIRIGCGIPSITIEGTTQDWEKVLEKTKYITKFKLDWWTSELIPIIQKIIDTKKGKFDKDFWMDMVKYHDDDSTHPVYGSRVSIDGWIVKFFPYTKEGKKRELMPIGNINNLAPELVKVPFTLEDIVDPKNKKNYKMEFWAGFVGLSQNKENYRLKPEIGWAVINLEHSKE